MTYNLFVSLMEKFLTADTMLDGVLAGRGTSLSLVGIEGTEKNMAGQSSWELCTADSSIPSSNQQDTLDAAHPRWGQAKHVC